MRCPTVFARRSGRGLPVLVRAPGADGWELFGVICGWEDGAPLILLGEDETPRKYIGPFSELIFVGGRRERPAPAEVYRRAVLAVPPAFAVRPRRPIRSAGARSTIGRTR